VLLFAVAAMHAGVFAIGPGTLHPAPERHSVMTMPGDAHPAAMASGDQGLGHGAMHGCVFILSVAALAFGVVLLYRLLDTGLLGGPNSVHWRAWRERPPPWTVPTLAELSILRI
jgi:hypothetical protein